MTKLLMIGGPRHGKLIEDLGHYIQITEPPPVQAGWIEPGTMPPTFDNYVHAYKKVSYAILDNIRHFYCHSSLPPDEGGKLFIDIILQVFDVYTEVADG
jgi:hypothetical protein